MAFKEIRDSLIARIGTLLPTYKQLHNIFNIEDNEERNLSKGFAVLWREGTQIDGPTRFLAFNASLVVSFTQKLNVRATDTQGPETGTLYGDIETVVKSVFNDTFLGLPTVIRGIRHASISAPVLIANKTHVKIDVNFDVDFKTPISY